MSAYHYVVDKFHVGTPDRKLLREIIKTRPKKAWNKAPLAQRRAFLRACLEAHRENQALYREVMYPSYREGKE